MKFILALIFIVMLTPQHTQARHIKIYTFNGSSSRQKPVERGCLDSVPLGCVTFKTAQTWTVGSQVWSDVVVATGCKKDYYDGGDLGNFKADCRQNEGYGDWFSWEMVNLYHKKLCPNGWRLPAMSDFVALDIALGGSGAIADDEALRDKYLDIWGAAYNGVCEYSDDYGKSIMYQGNAAYYWTLSSDEQQPNNAYFLHVLSNSHAGNGHTRPQAAMSKYSGLAVRCVK